MGLARSLKWREGFVLTASLLLQTSFLNPPPSFFFSILFLRQRFCRHKRKRNTVAQKGSGKGHEFSFTQHLSFGLPSTSQHVGSTASAGWTTQGKAVIRLIMLISHSSISQFCTGKLIQAPELSQSLHCSSQAQPRTSQHKIPHV